MCHLLPASCQSALQPARCLPPLPAVTHCLPLPLNHCAVLLAIYQVLTSTSAEAMAPLGLTPDLDASSTNTSASHCMHLACMRLLLARPQDAVN